MAALAVVEVGFAERSLAVVTGRAALRARRREMLRREGGTDLAALRRALRAHIVATVAVEPLARAVIRVAKTYAEGARRRTCRSIARGRVARAAGGNIDSARKLARRVALVTGLVRAQVCGDSLTHAAPRRGMTGRAAHLRPGFR